MMADFLVASSISGCRPAHSLGHLNKGAIVNAISNTCAIPMMSQVVCYEKGIKRSPADQFCPGALLAG